MTDNGRLELIDVGKRYGETTVLRGIDLAVEDGEFMTILGPSGSGKTTILRLIGGFIDPDDGEIRFDGEDVSAVPIHLRPFNTVFQDYALFPHMTVERNVGYGLKVRGTPASEIRQKVGEALDVVALGDLGSRYPAQLSGGQRQRVALARALVCEPKLILLDEPLGALDAELRRQMQTFLKSLQRKIGITFVFVTHDQEEAITMSDRITVMNQGMIEQIGRPDDIYYRPQSRFVATFFGDNNLIAGTKAAADRADTAMGPIRCADPGFDKVSDGEPVTIAVRPESLHLAFDRDPSSDDRTNSISIEIRSLDFVGSTSQVTVTPASAPDQPILLKTPSRMQGMPFGEGDRGFLTWSAEDCVVLPDSGKAA